VKWTFTRKITKKRMFFNAGLWIDKYRQYIVLGWYTHVTNLEIHGEQIGSRLVFLKKSWKNSKCCFCQSMVSWKKQGPLFFSFFIFWYSVFNEFQKLIHMREPPYYNTWKETNRGWFFFVVVGTQLCFISLKRNIWKHIKKMSHWFGLLLCSFQTNQSFLSIMDWKCTYFCYIIYLELMWLVGLSTCSHLCWLPMSCFFLSNWLIIVFLRLHSSFFWIRLIDHRVVLLVINSMDCWKNARHLKGDRFLNRFCL
jgi:hypothetical protein